MVRIIHKDMNARNKGINGLVDLSGRSQWIAIALAIITGITFGVTRVLEGSSVSTGVGPNVTMGAVVVTVLLGGFVNGYRSKGVVPSAVVALGAPVGLLTYLIAYQLVRPSSTDSPTWLLLLVFTGFFLVVGGIAHAAGGDR
jgi:asparagine N-glycosylation enzyme membrane subunit Stt3